MEFTGQKVLVVEDNLMSFKLIEAHLGRKNLQILHAKDGQQAIDLFRSDRDIKIVLMDIQLPKLTGIEVTKLIRETDPDIPILATTANVFDEDRQACEDAGCTNFITKPINFAELLDLLKDYLQ